MKEARRRGAALRTAGTFAIGAAVGSVVALLLAPVSGKVARKRIGMKLQNLQRRASRQFRSLERTASRKLGKQITSARSWMSNHLPNGHARRSTRRRVAVKHA